MAKPKVTPGQFLLFFFLLFVTSPISAFLTAKIADTLWGLLLVSQYGTGPSYQSWYGFSLLLAFGTHGMKANEPLEGDGIVFWFVSRVITHAAFGGLILLVAVFVRAVLGWS